jgi:hypothetical protein
MSSRSRPGEALLDMRETLDVLLAGDPEKLKA